MKNIFKKKLPITTSDPYFYCDIKDVHSGLKDLEENISKIYSLLKETNDKILEEDFTTYKWADEITYLNNQWENLIENSKYAVYMSEDQRIKEIKNLIENTNDFVAMRYKGGIFFGINTCMKYIFEQVLSVTPDIQRSVDNGDYYVDNYADLTIEEKKQLKSDTIDFKKNLKKLDEINKLAVEAFDLKSFKILSMPINNFNETTLKFQDKFEAIDMLWGGALTKYMSTSQCSVQEYLDNLISVQKYYLKSIKDLSNYEVTVPQVKGIDRVFEEPSLVEQLCSKERL